MSIIIFDIKKKKITVVFPLWDAMAPANEAVTYDLNAGGVAAALYAPKRV